MEGSGFLGSSFTTWGGMVVLGLLSFGIWLVWFLTLIRKFDVLYAAVGAELLSLSQIILSLLLLGFLGWLFPFPLAIVNISIAIGLAILLRRSGWKVSIGIIRVWVKSIRQVPLPWIGRIFIFLFAGILLRSFFQAFLLPPREWDGLVYHLPIMGAFYQAHAIRPLESLVVWVRSYPFSGELLSLWNLMFLGVDKLVDMPFLIPIAFGVLSVYGITRRIGGSREAAFMGAAIYAFAPVMILQQVSTSSDAFLASVFAIGVFLLWPRRTGLGETDHRSHLYWQALFCGLAIGLLASIKYTGVFYAVGLGFLFLISMREKLKAGISVLDMKTRIWVMVLVTMAAFSICGYPYLRNLVIEHNPIAPFNMELGGWTVFAGDRNREQIESDNTSETDLALNPIARVVRLWMEPYDTIYNSKLSGLGPLWVILAVPSIFPWLFISVRRKKFFPIALFVVSLLALLATPAYWVGRYAAPVLLVGGVAVAWIYDVLEKWPRLILGLITAGCMVFVTWSTMDLGSVDTKVLLEYITQRTDDNRSSVPFMWMGRDAFRYIEENSLMHPSAIAYGGLVRFIYPLYGANFRNTVYDISTSTPEDWAHSLAVNNIRFVVVVRGKPQLGWTETLTTYRKILEDDNYVLFERISED